jgi:Tol biopolymer transport system component
MKEGRPPLLDSPLRDGFRLGPHVVHPLLLRLDGPGGERRLEPQVMGVLLRLAERAGQPVPKAELLDRVWEGRFVSEDVLHRAISLLRTLLGDDARAQRAIETIPKVGYRLLWIPELVVATVPDPPPAGGRPSRRVWISAFGALLLVSLVAVVIALARTPPPASSGRPEPLVALAGIETHPALSNDGRRLAFSWDGEDGRRRIYGSETSANAVVSAPRRLTEGDGGDDYPVWSRDGEAIYFVRSDETACRVLGRDLRSGEEFELAACAPRSRAHLAIGGDALYWSDLDEREEHRHALRALDLAERRTRWITRPPEGAEDLHAAVSPDGTTLAFARGRPGSTAEVLELDLATGSLRRRTEDACAIHGLAWVDDKSLVVARGCAGRDPGLFLLEPGGRAIALETGGDRRSPVVSRDGRRIVFESWRQRANLVRAPFDPARGGAPPGPIAPSSRLDHSPALSPRGDRLAFVSDRTGVPELWTVGIDGAGLARRTALANAFISRPTWSPDGLRLVFTRWTGDTSDLCTIASSGGPARCFDDRAGHDLSPIFASDGASILYGSDRVQRGRFRIFRRGLAGGEPIEVVDGGVWPFAEIDGAVYYLDFREDGLRIHEPDGRDRVLLAEVPYAMASTVAVDRAGIRFARRDGTVVRCDLEGGDCRELGRLAGLHFRSGLILLEDGESAIFARHDKPEVEILALELPAGARG